MTTLITAAKETTRATVDLRFCICLRSMAKTNSNSQFRRVCRTVPISSHAITFYGSFLNRDNINRNKQNN